MGSYSKGAIYGALAGTPLAMLVNRYILGNTSGKSHAVAAAIGAGVGASAGLGISHALRSTNTPPNVPGLAARQPAPGPALSPEALKRLQDIDDFDERNELLKKELPDLDEGQARSANMMIQARKEYQRFINNPVVYGNGAPIADIFEGKADDQESMDYAAQRNQEMFAKLEEQSRRFRGRGKSVGDEFMWGGLNSQDKQARFAAIEAQTGMPRAQLAAVLNYHSKLNAVASSDLVRKNAIAHNLTPEQKHRMIDYMALMAMPEQQRKFVPLVHRMTSINRASLTNGWSYEIDRDYLLEPEYYKNVLNHQLFSEGVEGAMWLIPGVGMAPGIAASVINGIGPEIGSFVAGSRPEWSPEYSSNKPGWKDPFWRLTTNRQLSDFNKMPQYIWMLPSIRKNNGYRATLNSVIEPILAVQFARSAFKAPTKFGKVFSGGIAGLGGFSTWKNWKAAMDYWKNGKSMDPTAYTIGSMGGNTPEENAARFRAVAEEAGLLEAARQARKR